MGNSPIVARINSILAEKGIKKKDFFDFCDITSATYSQWNTGKTTPRTKNLEVIAKYLGVNIEYLQTGLGEKEKPIGENTDGLDKDLVRLLKNLDEDGLAQVWAFAQGIAAGRATKVSPDK